MAAGLSSMKIHCTVLRSITFSERIYTWLLDEKPIIYAISDVYITIFIDKWILIDKLNSKSNVEILYSWSILHSVHCASS